MLHTNFFQYNIPADNQTTGSTDKFINVLSTWESSQLYNDGSPMIHVEPVNFTFYDCLLIKDWHKAYNHINAIAKEHFTSIAKVEKEAKKRLDAIINQVEKSAVEPAY
jgi:hypothetical protein